MSRVYGLASLPTIIAAASAMLERVHCQAYLVAAQRIDVDVLHPMTPEQTVVANREIDRLMNGSFYAESEAHTKQAVRNAHANLVTLENSMADEKDFQLTVHAMLASVAMGAWTAFEVLASDLWISVVNLFPLLGVRAIGAEIRPEDNPPQVERKSKKQFPIIAQRVLDPTFDVKTSMGDLLADSFPMATWGRIIAAYKAIFLEDDAANIIRDSGLRSLAATRNAFAHNAGTADADFLQQIQGDVRFAGIQLDKPIELDAKISLELVASARDQGIKLIQFVDRWCKDANRANEPSIPTTTA